jgi:DNA-binding GntR family transcriptional regulator
MQLASLPSTSKRDRVADLLREAILAGEFTPGERLVESRLARQLGISQAPIREALALLERQGLVVKVHNRGTFVSRLHARELRELFTLRAVVDALAARLAAERSTPADVDRLRALLRRMRTAEKAGDLSALTEAHLQLHQAIYGLSGHGLLAEIFELICPRMTLALTFAENLFQPEGNETDCHIPLIDAIATGDAEAAERIARELALGWIDQVVVGDVNSDQGGKNEHDLEQER